MFRVEFFNLGLFFAGFSWLSEHSSSVDMIFFISFPKCCIAQTSTFLSNAPEYEQTKVPNNRHFPPYSRKYDSEAFSGNMRFRAPQPDGGRRWMATTARPPFQPQSQALPPRLQVYLA